jgi:hypothetical protein
VQAEPEKKKQPARIHPNERPKVKAFNQMSALFDGASGPAERISYYTPELIQCTLPHSDPKTRDWLRSSGKHTLIISSGLDEKGVPFGIPYGSFPRLVLAYIITQVVKNGERRIIFKSYLRSFLKEVGYLAKPNVRQAKQLHQWLERLFNAHITYDFKDDTKRGRKQFVVAPGSVLFWNYKVPDQGSLWDSFIEISEEFRASILKAPVPLRTEILSALRKSPLAIDLYMWVSYRLFTLHQKGEESLTLSFGSLQTQFGTSIAADNYRNFRHEVKLGLDKVKEQWERVSTADGKPGTIYYETDEDKFTLFRSPLLIERKQRNLDIPGKPSDAEAILSRKAFDTATLRKARQLAPTWDPKTLADSYFEWLKTKGIVPHNPAAHFLNFVRSHQKRNATDP